MDDDDLLVSVEIDDDGNGRLQIQLPPDLSADEREDIKSLIPRADGDLGTT